MENINAIYNAPPVVDSDLVKHAKVTAILEQVEPNQSNTLTDVAKKAIGEVTEAWKKLGENRIGANQKVNWWAGSKWWLQLGTLMFAMVYHDSAFPIYKSMSEPTLATWKRASGIGIGIISTVHIAFGLFAYLIFRGNLPDMILTADPVKAAFPCNIWTSIVRLVFGILLVLTYPICSLLCRIYVEAVVFRLQGKGKSGEEPDYPWTVRWSITAIILAISMVVVLTGGAEKADTFIEIAGGLGAGMIAFFLPSIVYLRVFGYQKIKSQTCEILASNEAGCCTKFNAILKLTLPILTCVVGTLASVFATVIAIIQAFGVKLK